MTPPRKQHTSTSTTDTGLLSRFTTDSRAVTFSVSHAILIGITAVIVIAVVGTTGGMVREQRQDVVRDELKVISDRAATSVMQVDQVKEPGTNTDVVVRQALPQRVAGQSYQVSLTTISGQPYIVAQTKTPSIRVKTPLQISTPIQETTVSRGAVYIVYNHSSNAITLTNQQPPPSRFTSDNAALNLSESVADVGNTPASAPVPSITDVSSTTDSTNSDITVSWKARDTDGDLKEGVLRLVSSDGVIRDSISLSMDGASEAGTTTLTTAVNGTYTIELIAYDDRGEASATESTVSVGDANGEPAPVVDVEKVTTYDSGSSGGSEDIIVDWTAQDPDDDLTKATINIYNSDTGALVESKEIPVTGGHLNEETVVPAIASGDYTVEVVVTDSNGDSGSDSGTVSF